MPLDAAATENLQGYIQDQLVSLSDADPMALADYILTLVTNEEPSHELKENCIEQLVDFLTEDPRPFIEGVFERIRALTASPGEIPQSMEPEPTPSSHTNERRARSRSPPRRSDSTPESSDRHADRGRTQNPDRYGQAVPAVPNGAQPATKSQKVCFTFQKKGRCKLGDNCRYQHIPGGAPKAEPYGMVRPIGPPYSMGWPQPPPMGNMGHMPMMNQFRPPMAFGGAPMAFGRPPFRPPMANIPTVPDNNWPVSDIEIAVFNIPYGFLSVDALTNYFSRFGEVKQVSLQADHSRAFVTFAEPSQAQAVIQTPGPHFQNPRTRVTWKRLPAQEEGGAPSSGPTPFRGGRPLPYRPHHREYMDTDSGSAPFARPPPGAEQSRKLLEIGKQREQLIQSHVAQQKEIMNQVLTLPSGSKERQVLMETLRTLEKTTKELMAAATEVTKLSTSVYTKPAAPPATGLESELDALRSKAQALGIPVAAATPTSTAPENH
ncbi:hypothetical protein H4R33_001695 [Dimargaris cristalligena]|uniref:C3H1-type domain-containing protein n=1 Tax=Dimargaris cristalligena TaxID=215637 RepID=A0A4Q0A2I5_9FUNG|nr:hypothetical protein H4R33_001695 [Dimargaris cristalligena]RKP40294.1 hypothetical protein BJ085DRAFT_37017 [Dimargaris cristalligena]|eukprot:RKP40294.1 hypothetical protein BJ085DRAFT_37017 [Dimargaris cristalligena]